MDFDLPGKGPVEGYKTGTEGSMAAAGAPWAALGGLGNQISDLGEDVAQHVIKLQQVENHRMADEIQLKADEMFDGFRDRMLKNPGSYGSWVQDWQKEREAFLKANMPDDLAPEQKMLIGDRLTKWSQRAGSEVMQQATLMTINQAKIATGNLVDRAYKTGDYDGGIEAIDSAPYMTDAEKERARMQFDEKFETQQVIQAAESNPKQTLDELKAKNDDGTYANFTNLDPASRNRAISAAEQNYRAGSFDDIERFNNGLLDGSISKPEQIDAKFPSASATLKKRMKDAVEREITDAERRMMQTPEYQQSVIGKVSGMIDSYSVELDDFDERFYEMDTLIRTLPEGPAKARLNYRLDAVRKGQIEEWKESADEWRSKLSDAYKAGAFGFSTSRQPVQRVLDDGILDDEGKLTAYGFTPEQAAEIGNQKDTPAKVMKFREMLKERAGFDQSEPYVRESLDIIASGKSGFVEYPDPKANQESERKYGAALDEFEKWHRANKDASPDVIEKKFYSLLSPEGAKRFSESILPPLDGPGVLPPYPDGE